jgi:hypothetical protein
MHHAFMTIKDDHRLAGVARRPKLLAAGGILAALRAASCCVVPFTLFMLGVSGAWFDRQRIRPDRRNNEGRLSGSCRER